jgi:uridine kinase
VTGQASAERGRPAPADARLRLRQIRQRLAASPAVRAFFGSPFFWVALAVKLVLGASLASYYLRDLFVPFLNYFVESGFANPWAHFAELGRLNSFPYPPVMLYLLAVPRWLLGPFLPAGTDTVTGLHLLVLRLPLLAADLGVALLLLHWFPHRVRRILLFYWCSPFVIYIAYWHGQLDLIPTALFVAALAFIRARRPGWGMLVYGLALAAKSHLWVALPFVLVYLYQEHGLRRAAQWAALTVLTYALSVLPYLPDPAYRQMVYGTQEQARLFAFQLPVGDGGLAVLLAPGAILLLWFRFAGYARRNWDLLMLYLGILFAVFVLLAPPAPGYFLWSLPFLVHFLARGRPGQALPYFAYALLYLAFFWLGDQSDLFDAWRLVSPALAARPTPYAQLAAADPARAALLQNGLFTLMQASLAGIILNMYLVGVRSNAVYRMRTTPVLIGIAGDSGAGKTTLCHLLTQTFGENRLTVINGDDYHRWPRGHEKWQVYTHLNIRGSNVHQQLEHAVAMHAGRSIVKGVYDHGTGQFTHPQEIDPSQYIVFSGLHSLSLDPMRRVFDLKIFLDPEESLRAQWKLRRDQHERGYAPEQVAAALAQRQPDRQAYILPQRETADLVLRLLPAPSGLALEVQALNGYDFSGLVNTLEGLEGARAELQPFLDSRWQALRLAADLPAARLLALAEAEVPNLYELAQRPQFASGLNGLIQLVIVICLSQKLRWGALPEA